MAIALSRLRRADAFEAEIRTLLHSKGLAPAEADRAIGFLVEKRLVDDRRTAERWVASRRAKGAGPQKLRDQLLQRGASAEDVEAALANYDAEGQRRSITELLVSRFKPGGDRAKAGRLLISRGFDPDEIEWSLDEYFGSG